MDKLTFEVNHSAEMLCRFSQYRTAKIRKSLLAFGVFMAFWGLLLIGAEALFPETAFTLEWGTVFLFCAAAAFAVFSRFTRRAVLKQIEANPAAHPLRSVYSFNEDSFTVETDYTEAKSTTVHKYSSVARVYIVDEKTVYVMFRYNTYAVIESEQCGNIIAWLSGKVEPRRFVKAKA